MTLKIFVATKDGDCAICRKNVKGSRALFNMKKELVHADCQFPDRAGKKPQAQAVSHPTQGAGSEGKQSLAPISDTRATMLTALKLDFEGCIDLMCTELHIPRDTIDPSAYPIIAALLESLKSKGWLALEQRKLGAR